MLGVCAERTAQTAGSLGRLSPAMQHRTEAAFVPAAISKFLQSPAAQEKRHPLSQPPAPCSPRDTQAGGGVMDSIPKAGSEHCPCQPNNSGNARRTRQQSVGSFHSRAGEGGMAQGSAPGMGPCLASPWWESGFLSPALEVSNLSHPGSIHQETPGRCLRNG